MTSKAVQTRRLYKFEAEVLLKHKFLGRDFPISFLRSIADYISEYHFGQSPNTYEIIAGDGVKYCGRNLSYNQDKKIVLSRNGRNVATLIHELVHAYGYENHDEKFVICMLELIEYFVDQTYKYKMYQLAIEYKILKERNF